MSRALIHATNRADNTSHLVACDTEGRLVTAKIALINVGITRPPNTTVYSVGDAVGQSAAGILQFTAGQRAGAGGYVTGASLATDDPTCTAEFRLHLFKTSPGNQTDNAAMSVSFGALQANYFGAIDFAALAAFGDGAVSVNNDLRLPFFPADDSQIIFGILEARTAFTPVADQNFDITLTADQN